MKSGGTCVNLPGRNLRVFSLAAAMLLLSLCIGVATSQQTAPPIDAPALGSLAPLPPMGWASWNHFFCDYDEKTIRDQADALVSSGMREAGYNYVVIQECIARTRDSSGHLLADSVRFPSGMPALTAYIHARGLKTGVYTDIGRHTCYPNPQYQGSYGHEQDDADTFAQWGMDFVEMDYCNREPAHTGRWVYERMADAIRHTGRPMVFYLCAWGNEQPWEWAQGYAQMWRTEYDISLEKNHVEWSRLVRNFESNTVHSGLSGPESWNDADMLEIGNPGLNDTEAQAQMSMWAISPSPLLAGADLMHMSPRSREIYLNREVIAVNQDPLGAGADKVAEPAPGLQIWAKPLTARTGGDIAVLLLNVSDTAAPMSFQWADLGIRAASVRDLWTHKTLPANTHGYAATLAPHSASLLRVRGNRLWASGVTLEAEWPGVLRNGAANLFPCGECSGGYAMALGGVSHNGSLLFRHLDVQDAGSYTARLFYTRNGLEDKQISLTVNDTPQTVLALMRSWNRVDVPVTLRAGENQISIGYGGAQSFYLDRVVLFKGTSPD